MTYTPEQALAAATADTHAAFTRIGRVDGSGRGPLAEMPFAAKDNLHTVGLPSGAGTRLLAENRPERDHPAIAAVKAAGAVLIGKTNMHELAFGITSDNGHFGAVQNPVAPDRSAGGSSGGSAAAVASGIVPFAFATDTGGSARIPAAWCGVAGFRPTTGRWGTGEAVPLSNTRDTIGLIARDVPLMQQIDEIVTGERTAPVPEQIRLGLPSVGYLDELDDDVRRVFDAVVERLRTAGVEIVAVDTDGIHRLDADGGLALVSQEVVTDLGAYLDARRAEGAQLPELVGLARELSSPDVHAVVAHALAQPAPESEYRRWLAVRDALIARLDAAHAGVDALLAPTVPIPAARIGENEDTERSGRRWPLFTTVTHNAAPGSYAGFPALTLPGGRTPDGLPVGIGLESARSADAALLALGAALAPIIAGDER